MRSAKSRDSKAGMQKAAIEKVRVIFANAEALSRANPGLADRYVRKARNTAQKARISIPREFRKRFCRHCGKFWVPGRTVRVRLQKQKVVYYCLSCRHYTRHPYVREIKAKRRAGR